MKKMGLMILGGLLIAVVSFIATAMSTYYILSKRVTSPEESKSAEKTSRTPSAVYSLDEFIVNLADPGHYLKAVIALELNKPAGNPRKGEHGVNKGELMDPEITFHIPKIKDAVITILTTKSFEELSTPQGKEALKKQIKNKVNFILGKELVSNVYFTSFTMQ